ncbi:MAG TPA: right-handed parallel beta-helix repeat-containing protein, partial [Phycisphaerales bacterium]|nr:right-handed parallel beta-helix repeat-containing protein [Phycisphaerales bacterium]
DAIFGNNVNGATISNCEIANLTNNGTGVQDDSATGTWVVSGNTLSNNDSFGIIFGVDNGGNLTLTISNNSITGNTNGGIGITGAGSGSMRCLISGNTLSGNGATGSVELSAGGTSNLCFDIFGNTNDGDYSFGRLGTIPVLEVEQLSQLLAINNNSGNIDNNNGGGLFPATEVADGACGF